MRVSLKEGKAFRVGLFAGKKNFEEGMLLARSTRGRSRGQLLPSLSPLPPRPGSACPVRGSPLPGAFPVPPGAGSGPRRAPGGAPRPLLSGRSAAGCIHRGAIFRRLRPLPSPFSSARTFSALRGFFSPTGPGGFPTRFFHKRCFLCDAGKPGPGPRRAGA